MQVYMQVAKVNAQINKVYNNIISLKINNMFCRLNHNCKFNYIRNYSNVSDYFIYHCKGCGHIIPPYIYETIICKKHKFPFYFGGIYDHNYCYNNYYDFNMNDIVLC